MDGPPWEETSGSGTVWYGAARIHIPQTQPNSIKIDCGTSPPPPQGDVDFLTHTQTTVHWFLGPTG
jgi:hypothetical protein